MKLLSSWNSSLTRLTKCPTTKLNSRTASLEPQWAWMDGVPQDTHLGHTGNSVHNTHIWLCYGTHYSKIQPTAHHYVQMVLPHSMAAASCQTTPNGSQTAWGGHQCGMWLRSPSHSHSAASWTPANMSGGQKDDRWQKHNLRSPLHSHGPAPDIPNNKHMTWKSLMQPCHHPYTRCQQHPNVCMTQKSLMQPWNGPLHNGHTIGTPNDQPASPLHNCWHHEPTCNMHRANNAWAHRRTHQTSHQSNWSRGRWLKKTVKCTSVST